MNNPGVFKSPFSLPVRTALDTVGPWEVLSRLPNTDVRFFGKEVGPIA
jgi:hypothetical protein